MWTSVFRAKNPFNRAQLELHRSNLKIVGCNKICLKFVIIIHASPKNGLVPNLLHLRRAWGWPILLACQVIWRKNVNNDLVQLLTVESVGEVLLTLQKRKTSMYNIHYSALPLSSKQRSWNLPHADFFTKILEHFHHWVKRAVWRWVVSSAQTGRKQLHSRCCMALRATVPFKSPLRFNMCWTKFTMLQYLRFISHVQYWNSEWLGLLVIGKLILQLFWAGLFGDVGSWTKLQYRGHYTNVCLYLR